MFRRAGRSVWVLNSALQVEVGPKLFFLQVVRIHIGYEREPFGGSISASVHFGGSISACVHFGGSCLLKGSRSMRYREFGVSSLSDLSGIMTPGMYTEHALPTIWQQYH